MLFISFPVASERPAPIIVDILPVAVPLVLFEGPRIPGDFFRPLESPLPMHHVFEPLAFVHSAVDPLENSPAFNSVRIEVALVHASVGHFEHALSLLDAVLVVAAVLGPICPLLHASSLIPVVFPLA